RDASRRLRFQLGQADKFRAGLVRSGAWEPHIRKTFSDMGLPVELAALPHVESSYTPHAYSRVGAAGLWQFTRSTGRRFLRVDHVVDERLDPYRSTVAAGRLLEQNRATTGSWPLAITAYNHGAAGMRRAVRKLGTRDIATIVSKYSSRTFGFASRNFYVEFLAAADVDFNAERYFGKLHLDTPIQYETLELPFYTTGPALASALGIEIGTLRESNPALRPSVWRGTKYVPRGFALRVPRGQLARPMAPAVDEIPTSQRFARQQRDTYHVVRRGETLSRIASRYGVRTSVLVELNGLRSRHRIRIGQKLRLPDSGHSTRVASARQSPTQPIAPPTDGVYTVRRGDTLSRIASRFGLDETELIRANGLPNRNRISVGQQLRVAELAAEPASADPYPDVVASLSTPTPAAEAETPTLSVTPSASPGVAVADPVEEATASSEGPALTADPSDYSVASNDTVEVQATETLGHYAEWLGIRASRLRQINGMRYRDPLVIGRRVELDFRGVSQDEFEARRLEYHRALQGEFFSRYEIDGTRLHVMRRGDSLWTLAQRKYQVPIWLLRQYNPDLDFGELHAGTRITIPILKPHSGAGASLLNSARLRLAARSR
ncbi:MAG: LysM peptidoglycan-binding domain-containing protein, partial [Proteobacteria bacterium]|nr:LysM peptidoglycan-binding domain-containing protein [Pseudomonadota bacterium]